MTRETFLELLRGIIFMAILLAVILAPWLFYPDAWLPWLQSLAR